MRSKTDWITVSGYVWKIAVNVSVLLIVWVSLFALKGQAEQIIVPVLGLIYVTICNIAKNQGLALTKIAMELQGQIDRMRYQLDGTFEMPDRAGEQTLLQRTERKWLIDAVFLTLISFSCMFAFFKAIS